MKVSMFDGPSTATLGSSATSFGSLTVWGLTQQQWAIYIGVATAIIAILSFLVQAMLAYSKFQLYRAQRDAVLQGIREDGESRQEDSDRSYR